MANIVKRNDYPSLPRGKKSSNNHFESSDHFYYMDEILEVLDGIKR